MIKLLSIVEKEFLNDAFYNSFDWQAAWDFIIYLKIFDMNLKQLCYITKNHAYESDKK